MYFEGAFAKQPNHIGAAIFIKQFQKHLINQISTTMDSSYYQTISDNDKIGLNNNFQSTALLNQMLIKQNILNLKQVQIMKDYKNLNENQYQTKLKTTQNDSTLLINDKKKEINELSLKNNPSLYNKQDDIIDYSLKANILNETLHINDKNENDRKDDNENYKGYDGIFNENLINKLNTISQMSKDLKNQITGKFYDISKQQIETGSLLSNITNIQIQSANKAVEQMKLSIEKNS
jgi:hypothetical protein